MSVATMMQHFFKGSVDDFFPEPDQKNKLPKFTIEMMDAQFPGMPNLARKKFMSTFMDVDGFPPPSPAESADDSVLIFLFLQDNEPKKHETMWITSPQYVVLPRGCMERRLVDDELFSIVTAMICDRFIRRVLKISQKVCWGCEQPTGRFTDFMHRLFMVQTTIEDNWIGFLDHFCLCPTSKSCNKMAVRPVLDFSKEYPCGNGICAHVLPELNKDLCHCQPSHSINPFVCNLCEKVVGNRKAVMACSRCKTSYYCSRECQVQDWSEHKKKCVVQKSDPDPKITTDTTATAAADEPKLSKKKKKSTFTTEQVEKDTQKKKKTTNKRKGKK